MRVRALLRIGLVLAILLTVGTLGAFGQGAGTDHAGPHNLDLADGADEAQYGFLTAALKGAEVVSLAESIHMTHEFPLARLGMVRWMNEHLGYGVLAMEGSPEDVWVSQDAFLRGPADVADSTSGLFAVWNTAEMRRLFAYEASTWGTRHPLYITAYDIQPGTGMGSRGARVFELLAGRLAQYAPPAKGFDQAAWVDSLNPLTMTCGAFKAEDAERVGEAIGALQEWIGRAAPAVDAAFPMVPHGTALRLVPENLRASLALCEQYVGGGASGAALYKPTRDRNAAQFALRLKAVAPGQRLILWAHVSHLFYNAEGWTTSVGQILHAELGPRLYTVGAFAAGGGTLMWFSDWNDIMGYGRVWGVSNALKRALDGGCPAVCFYGLRGADGVLSRPERVWVEAWPFQRMALAKDFDGIVWVRDVHPPEMTLRELVASCTPRYWERLAVGVGAVLLCLCMAVWLGWLVRRKVRSVSVSSVG